MPWVVYALLCADNSVYIGFTGDLAKRLERHRAGKVKWTRARLPVTVVQTEAFATRGQAVEREKQLKTTRGRRWLRCRVAAQAGLPAASRRRQAGLPGRIFERLAFGV